MKEEKTIVCERCECTVNDSQPYCHNCGSMLEPVQDAGEGAVRFTVVKAHSGTSAGEIAKAKKKFNEAHARGQVQGVSAGDLIQIQFEDKNGIITAKYVDEDGQELMGPIRIN